MSLSLVSGVVIGTVFVLLALAALTALGARRRGRGLTAAVAAGLFFPVTWFVWYLCDEHPFQRRPRLTTEKTVHRVGP